MPAAPAVQVSRKQIDALAAYFQLSYDRKFALSTAISLHQVLPGMRGFWPMSGVGVAGEALDMSGLGNHLSRTNDVDFGLDQMVPFAVYNGTNEYHSITDAASGNAFDISGLETFIRSSDQGVTVGGLFKFDDDPPAAIEFLIGKWVGGAGNRSYLLRRNVDTTIRFEVYDGAAVTFATTTATTTTATWYHIVGRLDVNSGDVFVYLDSAETITAAAVASINLGAADFAIGAGSGGAFFTDGRAAFCFVCVESLSKTWIITLHALLRALHE
jgi:hypothetical protein